MQSGNFKKFETQLKQYSSAHEIICEKINDWVRNTYAERSLDLQTVS